MMSEEIYNAIGTTGGVILACALIPQIVLAHKRRSAEDISYMWQVSDVDLCVDGLVLLSRCELLVLLLSRPHDSSDIIEDELVVQVTCSRSSLSCLGNVFGQP